MASSLSDILTAIQQGVTALNNLGAQVKGSFTSISSRFTGYESAWTAYTPTLTTNAGAYTTASASGRFKQMGKTVFVVVDISITTVGTGQYPLFTLPVAPLDFVEVVGSGAEISVTGKSLNARTGGGANIFLAYYDNSNPAASGNRFIISAVYEAA